MFIVDRPHIVSKVLQIKYVIELEDKGILAKYRDLSRMYSSN